MHRGGDAGRATCAQWGFVAFDVRKRRLLKPTTSSKLALRPLEHTAHGRDALPGRGLLGGLHEMPDHFFRVVTERYRRRPACRSGRSHTPLVVACKEPRERQDAHGRAFTSTFWIRTSRDIQFTRAPVCLSCADQMKSFFVFQANGLRVHGQDEVAVRREAYVSSSVGMKVILLHENVRILKGFGAL